MRIIITAVPERYKFVSEIVRRLNFSPEIIWDQNYIGSWWALRQAIIKMKEDTIILQDDALPCENFIQISEQAISLKPEEHIIFWSGSMTHKTKYDTAVKQKASWIRRLYGGTGVAHFLPYKDGKKFLLWADKSINFTKRNSDLRLAIWRVINRKTFLHTVPELVKHIGKESTLKTGNNKPEGFMFNENKHLVLNSKEYVSLEINEGDALGFLRRNTLDPNIISEFAAGLKELETRWHTEM